MFLHSVLVIRYLLQFVISSTSVVVWGDLGYLLYPDLIVNRTSFKVKVKPSHVFTYDPV